jgi:phosphohistidine swiveling domain-containing protein
LLSVKICQGNGFGQYSLNGSTLTARTINSSGTVVEDVNITARKALHRDMETMLKIKEKKSKFYRYML